MSLETEIAKYAVGSEITVMFASGAMIAGVLKAQADDTLIMERCMVAQAEASQGFAVKAAIKIDIEHIVAVWQE